MKKIITFFAVLMMTFLMTDAVNASNYDIVCYDHTADWYEGLWVDYDSPAAQKPVYNGWNIIMKGNQGENIIVCILDMDKNGELVDGREYTEADIITDWTGVTLYGKREDISEETGIVYCQTHDAQGKLHATFSMTGQSGNTYNVTYDENCQAVGDVQELQFTDGQVTLIDNTFVPAAGNFQVVAEIPGEVSMMVCVKSNKMAGTYTMADLIADYSDITWGDANSGEYSVLKFCDMQMTVTADPEKEGAYYYDINVVTKVGWAYHTMLHTTPWERPDIEITETAEIHSSNLRMMDFREAWGELLFVASSADYSVNLYARSAGTQGTYTNEDIDFPYNFVWYYEDGVEKQTKGIDGEYTYTESADGTRSLTGWLDCDNGVHYILDLHYGHAAFTRQVEIDAEYAVIDDQIGPDGGGIMIEAEGENQYVLIGIYTPEIEGTYTEQDMDWQTTYIVEFDNPDYEEYMLELLDANVTVSKNPDGETYNVEARMALQAEMNKDDIVEYVIHMTTAEATTRVKDLEGSDARKSKVRKLMRNGRVVILENGNVYDTYGIKLK